MPRIPFIFPDKGQNETVNYPSQAPDTSSDCNNVRAYDPIDKRRRGGSRAGLSKWFDAQMNGANQIQSLTKAVEAQANTDELLPATLHYYPHVSWNGIDGIYQFDRDLNATLFLTLNLPGKSHRCLNGDWIIPSAGDIGFGAKNIHRVTASAGTLWSELTGLIISSNTSGNYCTKNDIYVAHVGSGGGVQTIHGVSGETGLVVWSVDISNAVKRMVCMGDGFIYVPIQQGSDFPGNSGNNAVLLKLNTLTGAYVAEFNANDLSIYVVHVEYHPQKDVLTLITSVTSSSWDGGSGSANLFVLDRDLNLIKTHLMLPEVSGKSITRIVIMDEEFNWCIGESEDETLQSRDYETFTQRWVHAGPLGGADYSDLVIDRTRKPNRLLAFLDANKPYTGITGTGDLAIHNLETGRVEELRTAVTDTNGITSRGTQTMGMGVNGSDYMTAPVIVTRKTSVAAVIKGRVHLIEDGVQKTIIDGHLVTLVDPTDSPASTDALRDDIETVWTPSLETKLAGEAITLTLPALTDSPASLAALVTELNTQNGLIEVAFRNKGITLAIDDFVGVTDDAVREEFVTVCNPQIEAAFVLLRAQAGDLTHTQFKVRATSAFSDIFFVDGTNVKVLDLATDTLRIWTATSAGTLPALPRLIARWRGRVVLAGLLTDPHNWFMSRQGDPYDYDYAPAVIDATMAVAGNISETGLMGDIITALIPFDDDTLVVGMDQSIGKISGDPAAGGAIDIITDDTGMAWEAWALDPNNVLYFMGLDGIYRMGKDNLPVNITEDILDGAFEAIDLQKHRVLLEWDFRNKGLVVMVCSTDKNEVNQGYFFEQRTGGWFPMTFPVGMGPECLLKYDAEKADDKALIMGCRDGYIRKLDASATDDDGTAITSNVRLFPIGTRRGTDSRLYGLEVVLAEESGDVTLKCYTGQTAEQVATSTKVRWSRTLKAGRNVMTLPRLAGAWLQIEFTSTARWGLESVFGLFEEQGRSRRLKK